MRLREALANVDASRASLYPPVTLTGAIGSASPTLSNMLQNPVASLGVGLTLPFLQWNQMQLNIKISKTNYEERVVKFRQALYQAMADVETALSNRTQLRLQAEQLEASLHAAREAERLYEVRYRAGAVPLKDWLDAQERARRRLPGTKIVEPPGEPGDGLPGARRRRRLGLSRDALRRESQADLLPFP